MASRPSRPHERPPDSKSGRHHEGRGTKDSRGRQVEGPQWRYAWEEAKKIGEGSFGVVYKIMKYDLSPLGKKPLTVAVKCVDKRRGADGLSKAELIALMTLATERHLNIVAYLGKSEQVLDRSVFDCFEFEYIDGGDLFDYMWSIFDGGHSIQTSTIQYFTRQILLGLQYVHGKGFAHRDIKPENLMLTRHFVLKITDFGLAARMPHGYNYDTEIAGTLAYFGPERFADDIQGYASDIWAVGVTVFSLYFKGNIPFQAVDKYEIREKAVALYPKLTQQRRYDEIQEKERSLIRDHFRETRWPQGIDEWYESHKDAYDFIEKLLRVSHTRRPTAERALSEPWIKAIEPRGQQQHEHARPLSPAEAAKNKRQTGLVRLKVAVKPKKKEGRKSKLSKFLDKFTKG